MSGKDSFCFPYLKKIKKTFRVFLLFPKKYVILQSDYKKYKCKLLNKMGKLIVNSYEEFASHKGEVIGESEWLVVSQDMINKFADATLDHQWIHTDPERCAAESPYKQTIAHGYLQLSLLPYLWQEIIEVNNISMLVNYGMDKMKFGIPVLSGKRVKLTASLEDIANLRGICRAQIKFRLLVEGEKKFALEGLATFLYYFK